MAVRTTWTAGDVLTAADLTDTFGAKANSASPTFTGTPAAPTAAAGTNTTQVATTAFVQAASGLTLITTQSFSAVSSVSINNCFTATYDNYVLTAVVVGSTGADLDYRLRASGTDAATSYNTLYLLGNGAAAASGQITAGTIFRASYVRGSSLATTLHTQILRPFIAAATSFIVTSDDGQGTAARLHTGAHTTASAYDGITVLPTSGTITGSVSVYGYKK